MRLHNCNHTPFSLSMHSAYVFPLVAKLCDISSLKIRANVQGDEMQRLAYKRNHGAGLRTHLCGVVM